LNPPTGAKIMGRDGAKQLCTTGNGGVVMRAITQIEQLTRRGKTQSCTAIVVTELPYQVNKAALLETIAGLISDKKLDGIVDLRDKSDRDGIWVVLELKSDAVAAVVRNNLCKKTSLQTSFSGNFLALMGNEDNRSALKPKRFSLRDSLDYFLTFRFETIRRKSAFQLLKVEARIHLVEGLLLELGEVDQVMELFRSSPDQNGARDALMDPEGLLGLSKD
jgi:DNA gyrase subunit A